MQLLKSIVADITADITRPPICSVHQLPLEDPTASFCQLYSPDGCAATCDLPPPFSPPQLERHSLSTPGQSQISRPSKIVGARSHVARTFPFQKPRSSYSGGLDI